MRNIVYIDTKTRKIKNATHALFHEAHFVFDERPPGGQRLFQIGLKEMSALKETIPNNDLKAVLTDPKATVPTKASTFVAGYDLYSPQVYTIPPSSLTIINIGMKLQLPPGTHGRIASRSGLVVKHNIEVKAGVIDPDYTGDIRAVLHNFGKTEFKIQPKDRIAQLILENYLSALIKLSKHIDNTERGDNGFGSTGDISHNNTYCNNVTILQVQAADIDMCWHAPVFTTNMAIPNRGPHPTQGLVLSKQNHSAIVHDCNKGSLAAKNITRDKHSKVSKYCASTITP